MIDSLLVKLALIGVIGIGAQWIAWRTGRPAIALMLVAGILAGPVFQIIVPERDLGHLQEPIIKLAVAVILFEGGLSLNFKDLRHAGWPVLRLVIFGVPIGWALGALAARYGAGLGWEVSLLFGGILVVTGPTVIGPMLRTLRLPPRVSDTLRWEGIVNDPIGALLAVAIFGYITYLGPDTGIGPVAFDIGIATVAAGVIGVALGFAVTWLFPRGYVPEFLKSPVLLITVIAGFVVADIIKHETGLVTVTLMGVVMANRPIHSTHLLRRFKEDLTVLLISGVFVILSASLDWHTLEAFRARFVIFLILLLFVVRPVTVLVSLLGSSMPWRERLFIAWIAPRGIVAVAITGLFAIRLSQYGIPDADALVPLSFGVVIVTILAHGFSAKWVSKRLGIDRGKGEGVLIVGANDWTTALGVYLKDMGYPVTIADTSTYALRRPRRQELAVYRGDILDEVTQDHIDMGQFQQMLAASDNDAYNALVCADLGPEMGFERMIQTAPGEVRRGGVPSRGRVLLESRRSIDDLQRLMSEGWSFGRTRITEKFSFSDYRERLPEGGEPVAVRREDGELEFFSAGQKPFVEEDDQIISFLPPEPEAEKAARNEARASEAKAAKATADARAEQEERDTEQQ
ncbi:sodium:proton antiporter [Stakelama sediminis]|uniref:NhaP-type Na+/H+ or K+/H+ antiporter n=1 Tax=Stakelama sediminis TaxID=463200 RepID=A0A840YV30_9SPHN|nr:sodium:proton antiporter [Stakelama sediminis]MBB5717541.1 NhaP-type Na+/H+ or K+/H+ antiporter [Stakelama sediminis]